MKPDGQRGDGNLVNVLSSSIEISGCTEQTCTEHPIEQADSPPSNGSIVYTGFDAVGWTGLAVSLLLGGLALSLVRIRRHSVR